MPDARLEITLNHPAATDCEYTETKPKASACIVTGRCPKDSKIKRSPKQCLGTVHHSSPIWDIVPALQAKRKSKKQRQKTCEKVGLRQPLNKFFRN